MMRDNRNILDGIWRSAWRPHDRREIWEWLAEEGELPAGVYAVPGRFDIESAPMARGPWRALRDHRTRRVVVKTAVQCLKTLIGEAWLAWIPEHDPGPTQWVQPTDEEAKEHCEERFLKLIEAYPCVRRYFTENRHERTTTKLIFKHMWMRMEGAGTGNAQRKTVKNQMLSEVWQAEKWPPGRVREFSARTTQYESTWKQYIESQPGYAARLNVDDMASYYDGGTREVWQFKCEGCGAAQPYLWTWLSPDGSVRRGLRWDSNEKTRRGTNATDPNEIWRWDAVKASVRYECIQCGCPHPDDVGLRRRLARGGFFLGADGKNCDGVEWRSFNWNQLAMPNLSWFETQIGGVRNYLIAVSLAKQGYDVLLRDFWNKVAGQDYDPDVHSPAPRSETIEVSEPEVREGREVRVIEGIEFERVLMGVDVQNTSFWSLVDGFSKNGDQVALWAGQLFSWDEVEAKAAEFKVLPEDVACDISHRRMEVVQECSRRGRWVAWKGKKRWVAWKAMQGSAQHGFTYVVRKGKEAGRKVELPYSWPPAVGDPCIGMRSNDPRKHEFAGKFCQIIRWSNPSIKDLALSRVVGKAKAVKCLVAAGPWNRELDLQLHSQKKVYLSGHHGSGRWVWQKYRDDHLLDCRCMNLVRACMLHYVGAGAPKETE